MSTLTVKEPSVKTKKSKVDVVIPTIPTKKANDLSVTDLAARIDRLSEFILHARDDNSPFLREDVDYDSIKRLLRIDQQPLTTEDLENITATLTNGKYKHVDKVWVSRVCHMLGQAKTYQLQIVGLGRTIQNILAGSGVQYIENLRHISSDDYDLPLRLADIDEKTVYILEHEHLINNVCQLIEKLHQTEPLEEFIEALARQQLSAGTLPEVEDRLNRLEERVKNLCSSVSAFEEKLLRLVKLILKANQTQKSLEKLSN